MSPVAISPQASYCHCDVILIMTSRAFGARSPRFHYDIILIVTSFATDLATPTVTDVRTYVRADTLPRLIYKGMRCTCVARKKNPETVTAT